MKILLKDIRDLHFKVNVVTGRKELAKVFIVPKNMLVIKMMAPIISNAGNLTLIYQ